MGAGTFLRAAFGIFRLCRAAASEIRLYPTNKNVFDIARKLYYIV